METLYSIEDAAKKLGGVSRHTVVAWMCQRRLRRTKVGRRTMIAESELKRFIDLGNSLIVTAEHPRKEDAIA